MYRKLPGGNFRVLKKAWLDFVHEQKEKDGGQRYLPKAKRCHCGKSLTSYPHWPPSTYEEAVAQLQSLIGESFPHRLYLGHCWITSLYLKLAAGSEGVEKIISLVEQSCEGLRQNAKNQIANKVDCHAICDPVLKAQGTAKGSFCLCDCGRHREVCPIHKRASLYHSCH